MPFGAQRRQDGMARRRGRKSPRRQEVSRLRAPTGSIPSSGREQREDSWQNTNARGVGETAHLAMLATFG